MSDLVQRLRNGPAPLNDTDLNDEAADEIERLRADAEQAVAAERERWKVAATAATQELCQCAPWTAGGQAFASLRQLIDGPNAELSR